MHKKTFSSKFTAMSNFFRFSQINWFTFESKKWKICGSKSTKLNEKKAMTWKINFYANVGKETIHMDTIEGVPKLQFYCIIDEWILDFITYLSWHLRIIPCWMAIRNQWYRRCQTTKKKEKFVNIFWFNTHLIFRQDILMYMLSTMDYATVRVLIFFKKKKIMTIWERFFFLF